MLNLIRFPILDYVLNQMYNQMCNSMMCQVREKMNHETINEIIDITWSQCHAMSVIVNTQMYDCINKGEDNAIANRTPY